MFKFKTWNIFLPALQRTDIARLLAPTSIGSFSKRSGTQRSVRYQSPDQIPLGDVEIQGFQLSQILAGISEWIGLFWQR